MADKVPYILGICGSARDGSFNRAILNHAMARAESLGARVEFLDVQADDLPIFCEKLESRDGRPAKLDGWRAKCVEADGYLIASPEYNGGPTGLLKNFLDWISRPSEGAPGTPFRHKPVGIVSASTGRLGGIKGLQCLRFILSHLGMHISGKEFAFAEAKVNTADGKVTNEFMAGELDAVTDYLVDLARK